MKALLKYGFAVTIGVALVVLMVCMIHMLKMRTSDAVVSFLCLYLFVGIVGLFVLVILKRFFKNSKLIRFLTE